AEHAAEPVPDPRRPPRRRRALDPRPRSDRGRARNGRGDLGVLPLHEGRPRHARGRDGAGAGEPARDPHELDPRTRLGAPGGGRAAELAALAAAVVVIVLLPRFISDYHALEVGKVGMYFVAILGLAVLTGYSGQISLGHGAFMAIGAYTTAILAGHHHWGEL